MLPFMMKLNLKMSFLVCLDILQAVGLNSSIPTNILEFLINVSFQLIELFNAVFTGLCCTYRSNHHYLILAKYLKELCII